MGIKLQKIVLELYSVCMYCIYEEYLYFTTGTFLTSFFSLSNMPDVVEMEENLPVEGDHLQERTVSMGQDRYILF